MKKGLMIVGGIFLVIGVLMLFSSFTSLTGFVILENFSFLWQRVLSILIIVVGLIIMSAEEINAAIRSKGTLEERVGYGKNVEIHTIFVRHGEKDKEGQLTYAGIEQAKAYGRSLGERTAIKGYSSRMQRAIDTTENAINAAPHNKRLKTRIRRELGMPGMSKDFLNEYIKHVKEGGENGAADWYFGLGNKRFDKETASAKEVAEGFAYMLRKNIRMSGKLYTGSKVDLVNGTHQLLPESLLKEVMIRDVNGKKVRGFDSVEEIGGVLKYTEPVDFAIKRDGGGETYVQLHFRGQEYDVDMGRLNQLASAYSRRVKGRKQ